MIIKTTDVFVDLGRDRKDFGSIIELAESLQTYGQIQPIVVQNRGSEIKPWKLIAGERRFRAALLSGWAEIEACEKTDLSTLQMKELEFEENIKRKNLDWSEEVMAKAALDALKRKQHGSATGGKNAVEGWDQGKTATLLNESRSTTSKDLDLARRLQENPELIAKYANFPKAVAYKKIKAEEKSAKVKKQISEGTIKIHSCLKKGKAEDLIDELEDNSVDLLLTDPPYGVEDIDKADANYISSMLGNETNNATFEYWEKLMHTLIPKLFAKMKPSAHFYIFFGIETYQPLKDMLEDAGFHVDPVPLIWDKTMTTTAFKGLSHQQQYEPILFGCKPPREKYLSSPVTTVLKEKPVSATVKTHPFEKPSLLLDGLIKRSSIGGDTILDPFAGSGSVLTCGRQAGRCVVGYECDEDNYLIAQDNLNRSISLMESIAMGTR